MRVETLEGSLKGKRNMEDINLSGEKTPFEHALVDEEILEVKKKSTCEVSKGRG
jgi:hypothetical protein